MRSDQPQSRVAVQRSNPDETDSDLESIRRTYEAYHSTGHDRRWSHTNAGEALLSAQAQQLIVDLIARSLDGATGRVLDLGCGDGSLAGMARPRLGNAEWVGVDIREEAIEIARSQHGWATFEVASAAELPYDDESFDVVVAAVLFSSLPSAELERGVSSEIARVLKPGGRLIWYDMRFPNPWNAAIHHMPARRIRSLFRGWSTSLRSVTLLPPLARRLGAHTSRRYARLHRLPFLRSHLVGRLAKPRKITV